MTEPLPPSRRAFVRALAAAGLCSAMEWNARTGSLARASFAAGRKMTMDLVPGNIGVKTTLPEAIDLAHRYGFESVAPDASYLAPLSDSQVQDLLGEMKEKRLVFGAAGLPVDFRGDESNFRGGMERLPRDAKALQRAGVTRVGTWLRPGDNQLTYPANFRRHIVRLREIATVLRDHGLRFGLEYVGPKTSWTASKYPFVHTMAETKELLGEMARDNAGLVLDSWHWYNAGESPADILALTNKDVVACDLNDAPAGIPVDRQRDNVRDLPTATGVIDLKGFLSALVTIGYDGPVRAEPFKQELRQLPRDEAMERTSKAMKTAFALIGG
jgi:sugar phosphate isomerase/epimerase